MENTNQVVIPSLLSLSIEGWKDYLKFERIREMYERITGVSQLNLTPKGLRMERYSDLEQELIKMASLSLKEIEKRYGDIMIKILDNIFNEKSVERIREINERQVELLAFLIKAHQDTFHNRITTSLVTQRQTRYSDYRPDQIELTLKESGQVLMFRESYRVADRETLIFFKSKAHIESREEWLEMRDAQEINVDLHYPIVNQGVVKMNLKDLEQVMLALAQNFENTYCLCHTSFQYGFCCHLAYLKCALINKSIYKEINRLNESRNIAIYKKIGSSSRGTRRNFFAPQPIVTVSPQIVNAPNTPQNIALTEEDLYFTTLNEQFYNISTEFHILGQGLSNVDTSDEYQVNLMDMIPIETKKEEEEQEMDISQDFPLVNDQEDTEIWNLLNQHY